MTVCPSRHPLRPARLSAKSAASHGFTRLAVFPPPLAKASSPSFEAHTKENSTRRQRRLQRTGSPTRLDERLAPLSASPASTLNCDTELTDSVCAPADRRRVNALLSRTLLHRRPSRRRRLLLAAAFAITQRPGIGGSLHFYVSQLCPIGPVCVKCNGKKMAHTHSDGRNTPLCVCVSAHFFHLKPLSCNAIVCFLPPTNLILLPLCRCRLHSPSLTRQIQI